MRDKGDSTFCQRLTNRASPWVGHIRHKLSGKLYISVHVSKSWYILRLRQSHGHKTTAVDAIHHCSKR